MKELADALKALLADEIAMYLKAQGAHWNVEGPMFHSFHAFFAEVYEDVSGSVDPTAENIRKVGEYAPFTFSTLSALADVDDAKMASDPIAMCEALNDANDKVIDSIAAAFTLAEDEDEQGIMNFLADRDDMHKKWRWQLRAILSS